MVLRGCRSIAREKEPQRTKQVRALELKALLRASTCPHKGGEKWLAGTAKTFHVHLAITQAITFLSLSIKVV